MHGVPKGVGDQICVWLRSAVNSVTLEMAETKEQLCE